jgi:hypothetical protein
MARSRKVRANDYPIAGVCFARACPWPRDPIALVAKPVVLAMIAPALAAALLRAANVSVQ